MSEAYSEGGHITNASEDAERHKGVFGQPFLVER